MINSILPYWTFKKLLKNSKGFSTAEILITLLIIGIIFALIINAWNVNTKNAINIVKYRKVYDNLDVAMKAVNLTPTGLKVALTNNPDQVLDVISKQISTQETFSGCKYENLKQLIGDSACNADNVKGTVLSDGTPISFIAANDSTNLDNNLIMHGKSIKKASGADGGLVGAIVVNNNNKTLDDSSIIPVYEDGLGGLTTEKNISGIVALFIPEDNTPKIDNCESINHIWINDECKTPSETNCNEAGYGFYNNECGPPTSQICQKLGKVLFEGQCRNCSTEFIDDIKVAYNILQNAINESIKVNGPVSEWTFNADGWCAGNPPNATFFAKKYIVPYLDVDYICTYEKTSKKCFYGPNNEFYGDWKGLKNGWCDANEPQVITTYAGAGQSYMVRLTNGMSVAISEYGEDVKIIVDIDGPNNGSSITGYDVFEFQLTKSGFKPYRLSWYGNNCTTTGNPCSGAQHHGGGRPCCAAYIIDNGWKRPDDYPYCHE